MSIEVEICFLDFKIVFQFYNTKVLSACNTYSTRQYHFSLLDTCVLYFTEGVNYSDNRNTGRGGLREKWKLRNELKNWKNASQNTGCFI